MNPIFALIVVIAVLMLHVIPVSGQIPKTNEERGKVVRSLPWLHGGVFHLTDSKMTLTMGKRFDVVTGSDAGKFWEAINGTPAPANLEAIVTNQEGDYVSFQRVTEGYVKFDDWHDLDPAKLIQNITDNTNKAAEEQIKNNVDPLEVVGWHQQPTLDVQSQTVQWSIDAREKKSQTPVRNATMLIFGRYGYEDITWAGPPDHNATAFLESMRRSATFDAGARYSDFLKTDKIAPYTIGALVAGLLGAKAVKLGLVAGLLLFVKKAFVLVIAALAGLFGLLKRILTGKASVEEKA